MQFLTDDYLKKIRESVIDNLPISDSCKKGLWFNLKSDGDIFTVVFSAATLAANKGISKKEKVNLEMAVHEALECL